MENKVVVVVVEGESDEALLEDRLEEYYEYNNIKFAVTGNDIFNASKPTTIVRNISNHIKKLQDKIKFDKEDILCVIHITDTDGCYIDDEAIVIDTSQKDKTLYYEQNVSVNSDKQKENIEQRNKAKRNNTDVMYPCDTIMFDRKEIKYQLFYFSRHLEHVLFDEPSRNKKAKISEVTKFLESLDVDLEKWLLDYVPAITGEDYSSRYESSWRYIKKELNSLKRGTSVPLLFEYIDEILSEDND